jgi:predicted RNA-binding protein associated with RNAse of E/G family
VCDEGFTARGLIQSGVFGDPAALRDYRSEQLGDILVERIIWDGQPNPGRLAGDIVADDGHIWFRFWLPGEDQVVERYYDDQGRLIGTQIDVCTSLCYDERGWRAEDLIFDIWISPDEQVTVHNEAAFDQAVLLGELDPAQAERAERHLRRLTAAIALRRFPPPLVRNWQIDSDRVTET